MRRNLKVFQSKRKLDLIEEDTRKRLFFTIYKMDIYVNSLLGLPQSISEDEFDQEFPIELYDELITRDELLVDQQQGRLLSSACASQHTKLAMILSKIVKALYPIKMNMKSADGILSSNIHEKVTELEHELKRWCDNLPPELSPTDLSNVSCDRFVPEKFKLANYYLRISFLNCKICLYRPFIHFISNGRSGTKPDSRLLKRGRNCIKVARTVVKLASKMIEEKLLIGTYWFSIYTIFFSIACLIYYFHFAKYNNLVNRAAEVNYAGVYFDDDLIIDLIEAGIEIGKKVLNTLKNMSHSSMRIYNILNRLFVQLNQKAANNSLANKLVGVNSANIGKSFLDFDIDIIGGLDSNKSTTFRDPKERGKCILDGKNVEDQVHDFLAESQPVSQASEFAKKSSSGATRLECLTAKISIADTTSSLGIEKLHNFAGQALLDCEETLSAQIPELAYQAVLMRLWTTSLK